MEGQTLGKYQISTAIGRGAAGTVWRAIDPVIERTVAIKTIKLDDAGDAETAEEIGRFKRKTRLTLFQPKRWKETLTTRIRKGKDLGLDEEFLLRVYQYIHEESIRHQEEGAKD